MSDITQIPALASLYATPVAPPVGGSDLGEDAFLKLLTTQLQYQDPSNPVTNEAFVAQLAQFSSLEQLQTVNGTLDGVYAALAAMNNSSMASLLGTSVTARGDTFNYSGTGTVGLDYLASSEVPNATLTVYDEGGGVVFSGPAGSVVEGEGTLTWDGLDTNGNPVASGVYTFSITGNDASGNPVDVEERISGTIDKMDFSTGVPVPYVDGNAVNIADILTLQSASIP